MISAVPTEMPLTIPVKAPTVATPGVPELHEPVVLTSDNMVVEPEHSPAAPRIAPGWKLTVNIISALQPVGRV